MVKGRGKKGAKREKDEFYLKYPGWIVAVSNIVSLTIYVIGALLMYLIDETWGVVWLSIYIAYIIILEFRLIGGHCVDCYYYGKRCAFGKGKISAMLFKKGKAEDFCKREMTVKDLVPDFLVGFVPIVIGIVELIGDFKWEILVMIIALVVLMTMGNAYVRGQLACRYCMQRKIGCPAQKMFEKKKR